VGCKYDDISGADARKCLGNRTLAFVGDSQIRDLTVGIAHLLMGVTLEEALDVKFDKNHELGHNGTEIGFYSMWNSTKYDQRGNYIFPQPPLGKLHQWEWQVQYWGFYRNDLLEGHVGDVMSGKVSQQGQKDVKPIDILFWSHGLHDWGWWDKKPYGENFYKTMLNQWLRLRDESPFPSVWVSMNPNCASKIGGTLGPPPQQQWDMIENANAYVNQETLAKKVPYFDAAAPLRTPDRCEHSADGIHTKMYVDIMRAKMLFNHLCDPEMNYRGHEVLAHFT